jgi:hypothetical protein
MEARKELETARWLQQVCGASVVFVTVCSDENTLERIAAAVAEASKPTTTPT